MLEQTARVVALHAAGVEVCARPSAACARCERGRGCGGGLIGALLPRNRRTLLARPGPVPVRVGDTVTLRLAARTLLEAAGLAYLLPLAAMLLALALASLFAAAPSDALLALVALGGLASGACCARWALRAGRRQRWQPVAIARGAEHDVPGAAS